MKRIVQVYRVELYATALGLTSSCVALLTLYVHRDLGELWVVAGLAALAAIAERGSVRLSTSLSTSVEQSLSLLPTLFAAVAFGPLAGLAVGAVSNLGDLRRPYLKWVVYTSTRALGGVAAGTAAIMAGSPAAGDMGSVVLATAAGGLAITFCDVGFSLLTYKVKQNGRALELLRDALPVVAPVLPLWMPVVALLAYSYEHVSPWTLLLFSVPALAAHRSFVLYQEQRRLTAELQLANDRLEAANLSFATALVATLDARDEYTAGHSAAVAIYSRDIAARMGLSGDEQRKVHLCGLVHDIGKIGLPAGLLEKPGALTLEERRIMQRHSEIGERILANVDDYRDIAKIVRHHHERVDGNGYPTGLNEEAIPLLSRIIAVADAYNAMTSDRPYREAMSSRVARLRLAQAVGSQFDTSVVAAFEAILATADEDYRMGARPDFDLSRRTAITQPHSIAEVA
jgi:putative nucleotidyltransferase with HDIG domain